MNLLVYSSQVTILSNLADGFSAEKLTLPEINTISNWIQLMPGSVISMINATAYCILGIPSVLFGWAMLRENKNGKIAGILLILSALVSFTGIIGIIIKNKVMGYGILMGGLLFTIAVVFIYQMFKNIAPASQSCAE